MKKRRVVTVAITALLAAGCITTIAAPALAATGGVDMQAACNNQYPGQGRIAKVRTYNVYGWKCVSGAVPVADGNIDVWRQCRTQYRNPNASASFRSYNDPYSWYCIY